MQLPATTALLAVGTIFFIVVYPSADARLRELPLPASLKECYLRGQNYTMQHFVGSLYCWFCETPTRADIKEYDPHSLSDQQSDYIKELFETVKSESYLDDDDDGQSKEGDQSQEGGQSKAGLRRKRQARRCVRKEYRALTDDERNRFHRAVSALKQDRSISPNAYDSLALFHIGQSSFIAHNGPGFCGWHRVYLLLFEAALQRVDPSVCCPYWDTTLDSHLANPASSYLWSPDFLGNGRGQVTTGPFANWNTPGSGPLTRSVGSDGTLMTTGMVQRILASNTYADIMLPDSDPLTSLEISHGGPHVFCGGQMSRLDAAAMDPTFFLYHCYIDFLFEQFRDKLRRNGQNPETYPLNALVNSFHQPEATMGPMGNVPQRVGYSNSIVTYTYEPSPTCSRARPDCGSRYLGCDVARSRCVPVDPANNPFAPATSPPPPPPPPPPSPPPPPPPPSPPPPPPPTARPQPPPPPPPPATPRPFNPPPPPPPPPPTPRPFNPPPPPFRPPPPPPPPRPPPLPLRSPLIIPFRSSFFSRFKRDAASPLPSSSPTPSPVPEPTPSPDTCAEPKPQSYQNSFCVNGKCDVSHWVWIPVKIVALRPPEFSDCDSYPVMKGMIWKGHDIYSPDADTNMYRYLDPSKPKPLAYEDCKVKDGVGKVFVSSKGLSYDGVYKESAIVDQRMATGMSISFVAVKDPGAKGKTEVLLRAHDQCGRICLTSCLVHGSNPKRYQKCSGVVEVTSKEPKQYGKTYSDALLMVYGYDRDAICPVFIDHDFFITFYCDYTNYLPWVDEPKH